MQYKTMPGAYCVYCGGEYQTRDHVLPVSFVAVCRYTFHFDHLLFTVPCCRKCNSVAGAKWFETFAAKAAYIQKRTRVFDNALRMAKEVQDFMNKEGLVQKLDIRMVMSDNTCRNCGRGLRASKLGKLRFVCSVCLKGDV